MPLLEPLASHKTLAIMLTYECTAACCHCGSHSNPKQLPRLRPEHMISAITQAIDAGYETVVFSGGEPTLAQEALLAGIRAASSRGARTRLVSNGWWAKDEDAADRQIEQLHAAGLSELNISTGDEHARFVPLDHVILACRAAAKVPIGMIVIIVEAAEGRTITRNTIYRHSQFRDTRKQFPHARILVVESPWMPLSTTPGLRYRPGAATQSDSLPMRTGCTNCLGTTTLHPDGSLTACCGTAMRTIPEMFLGNIDEITVREADRCGGDDFLKHWIRVEGPENILAWAAKKDPQILWEGMYANRCQSCLRIYKDPRIRELIRKHYPEKMAEVLEAEWLLYAYQLPQVAEV
jgi:organic radical activating enzyme